MTVEKRLFENVLQLVEQKVREWGKGQVDCGQKIPMGIETLQYDVFMLNLLLAFRWF